MPEAVNSGIQTAVPVGVHDSVIYVGKADGLIHEYIYNITSSQWIPGFTFVTSNAYGSITLTYLDYIFTLYNTNANAKVECWWNGNLNAANSLNNQANTWVQGEPIVFIIDTKVLSLEQLK